MAALQELRSHRSRPRTRDGRGLTPPGACAPCVAAQPESLGRHEYACATESRASWRGAGCSAGTYAYSRVDSCARFCGRVRMRGAGIDVRSRRRRSARPDQDRAYNEVGRHAPVAPLVRLIAQVFPHRPRDVRRLWISSLNRRCRRGYCRPTEDRADAGAAPAIAPGKGVSPGETGQSHILPPSRVTPFRCAHQPGGHVHNMWTGMWKRSCASKSCSTRRRITVTKSFSTRKADSWARPTFPPKRVMPPRSPALSPRTTYRGDDARVAEGRRAAPVSEL